MPYRATPIRRGTPLLIPTYTWDEATWSKPLAQICRTGSAVPGRWLLIQYGKNLPIGQR